MIKDINNLVFRPHLYDHRTKRATMYFENNYGISVLKGTNIMGMEVYSNGIDTYEVAVLRDGKFCDDTPITDNVIRYATAEEVSDIMKRIQELPRYKE